MTRRWIGSPEHQFNVGGKDKCPYCGDYFLSHLIDSHMDNCRLNPEKQEDTE